MYRQLRSLWVNKINALLAHKGVDVANLVQPDWEDQLNTTTGWRNINQYGSDVCRDIYDKATIHQGEAFPNGVSHDNPGALFGAVPQVNADNGEPFWNVFWNDYFFNWEEQTIAFNLLMIELDYTPTVNDMDVNHPWQDLITLLNNETLQEAVNGSRMADGYITDVKTLLNIAVADPVPQNWVTQVVKKTDLDTATATIAALTTERDNYKVKADEYDRIHAKLNGKVSDGELDALLNKAPSCAHTDYDALKTERDTLKTEKTELAKKESQLLEKFITDCNLGLSINSNFEQVIAKIKELINKPAPTSDTTAKDLEITQLKQQLATEKQKNTSDSEKVITKEELVQGAKQCFKELGVTASTTQLAKLESVATVNEVEQMRNELVKSRIEELQVDKKSAHTLNIVLGLVTIGTLGILAYLIIKRGKDDIEKGGIVKERE